MSVTILLTLFVFVQKLAVSQERVISVEHIVILPAHPRSHPVGPDQFSICVCKQRRLVRLGRCAGSPQTLHGPAPILQPKQISDLWFLEQFLNVFNFLSILTAVPKLSISPSGEVLPFFSLWKIIQVAPYFKKLKISISPSGEVLSFFSLWKIIQVAPYFKKLKSWMVVFYLSNQKFVGWKRLEIFCACYRIVVIGPNYTRRNDIVYIDTDQTAPSGLICITCWQMCLSQYLAFYSMWC